MDPTVKELFDSGKQSFEARNYPHAEQSFLKILKAGRKFADVFNMLGVITHAEGKFSDAIHYFQEALKINPNYTEATLNLAVLHNDLGQYKESKTLYSRLHKRRTATLTEIDPVMKGKISNLHAAVADTYSGIGRYREAIDEYKKALELNPHFVDIRTKLGIALRENGALNDSLKTLREASETNPHFLVARIQLGVTFCALNRMKEASNEWAAVLKKDPDNLTARMYLKLCEPNGEKPAVTRRKKRLD